jgi:ribosomal protein S18 acetylase RimI-like enzyme
MIIRLYRPGDFQQIEDLWKETGIYTVERGDTAELISQCSTQGGKFLILEDDSSKRIIGTSWLTWDGRRIYMHHFAILPAFQGLGYGRKLALESLSFASEKKAPMKLEVHGQNLRAIQLYKSLGFKVFKDYDVYMIHHDS